MSKLRCKVFQQLACFLSMTKPVSAATSITKATVSSICNHCGGSGQQRVACWTYRTCMVCVGTGVIKLVQAS
jgi:DnaJ-class molecular chaperone